jgi:hypothetical protein
VNARAGTTDRERGACIVWASSVADSITKGTDQQNIQPIPASLQLQFSFPFSQ